MSSTSRSRRSAAALGANLMLAPAVVAMRLPLLMAEAGSHGQLRPESVRAVVEKSGAWMEGMMQAQLSIMMSAAAFWPELMSGRTPSLISGAALDRAAQAAMRPSGKQVRANYRRLSR